MRKHWGTPYRREKHVTQAAISPPWCCPGPLCWGPPVRSSGLPSSSAEPLPVRQRGDPRGNRGAPLHDRVHLTTYLPYGGPQVEVAVSSGDYELGVAVTRGCVPQDGVLGRRPVRLVQQSVAVVRGGWGKPKRVLGVLSVHAQAVLRPARGHLVDQPLPRPRGLPWPARDPRVAEGRG